MKMEKSNTLYYKKYKLKFNELLLSKPYCVDSKSKSNFYKAMNFLTKHHYLKCKKYKNILSQIQFSLKKDYNLNLLPFLTSNIFKEQELKSIDDRDTFKVINSSGTSNQKPSKIFLDKNNSFSQIKVLSHIFQDFFNEKNRIPMLIIDTKKTISDKKSFSARSAGILGFSNFGRDITYALNENMDINYKILNDFLAKYKNEKKIIYGFTFVIWKYFIQKLVKEKLTIDFDKSILIHGGGWKKLLNKKINNSSFKKRIKKQINVKNVYNYYGMVEQAGSIFFECEKGYFHCSNFSNIIVRSPDFKEKKFKNKGIVQLQSLIPTSYPGHNLLTEDVGEVFGQDTCSCGRSGKFFKIYGRTLKSEIKGCSDTLLI